MARNKSPSQVLFADVVKRSVTSILKPIGFRKSALNFHRRHGQVVQVVNLQRSQGSSSSDIRFYVNVGISFDAICKLMDIEILEKPKEYQCDSRGTQDRLESLVADAQDSWSVTADGGDSEGVAQQLHKCMDLLADDLQKIDGVLSYREHRWFNRFRPKEENAQMLYILGDLDAAWTEVEDLCTLFRDRQNGSQPGSWIESLRLKELAGRL